MRDNQLTGTIPPGLSNLTYLRELYFSFSPSFFVFSFTNFIFLPSFSPSPSLLLPLPSFPSSLLPSYLSRNQLTGEIPVELASLEFLQKLYFPSLILFTPPPPFFLPLIFLFLSCLPLLLPFPPSFLPLSPFPFHLLPFLLLLLLPFFPFTLLSSLLPLSPFPFINTALPSLPSLLSSSPWPQCF